MDNYSYENLRDLEVHCQHCEEIIDFHYHETLNKILYTKTRCFSCNFWLGVINDYKTGRTFSTGKVCYTPNIKRLLTREEIRERGFVGFGGRIFHVLMRDGEEYYTNDLWCRGDIPEIWRDQLPANAAFV